MSQDEKVPDHYKMKGELHWDRQWRLYGRAYFTGQITKYIERYHRKHGLRDLKKALHFIEKLTELETAAMNGTGPLGGINGEEGKQPPLKEIPDEITQSTQLPEIVFSVPSFPNIMSRIPIVTGLSPSEKTIVDNHGFGDPHADLGMCEFGHHKFEVVPDYQGGRVCVHCGTHEE